MSVILKNKIRRSLVYNLSHTAFCEPRGKCECVESTVPKTDHNGSTGFLKVTKVKKKYPPVLTILPFTRTESLPDEVLEIQAIGDAVKNRELQIVTQSSSPAAPPSELEEVLPVRDRASRKKKPSKERSD